MRTSKQYKDLTIKEFTRAAEIYDSGHAGIYEICKDDYPLILEELKKEPFSDLLDAGCGTGVAGAGVAGTGAGAAGAGATGTGAAGAAGVGAAGAGA